MTRDHADGLLDRSLRAVKRHGPVGVAREVGHRLRERILSRKRLLLFEVDPRAVRQVTPVLQPGEAFSTRILPPDEALGILQPRDQMVLRGHLDGRLGMEILIVGFIDGRVAGWNLLANPPILAWPLSETASELVLAPTDSVFTAGYVVPEFRGRRVFQAMYVATAAVAASHAASRLWSWCEEWNEASRRAMLAVGFQPAGSHTRPRLLGFRRALVIDDDRTDAPSGVAKRPPTSDSRVPVQVVNPGNPLVRETEGRIDAANVSLPLTSRTSWLQHLGSSHDRVLIHDDGASVGMLAIHSGRSRVMPTHRIWRISVGDSMASVAGTRLLTEATRLARKKYRVLRFFAEVECIEDHHRAALAGTLSALGFRRIPRERIPETTLLIDLSQSEEALLAGFSQSTRQNIRGADKQGLRVIPLVDPSLGQRMNEMVGQSFARTGSDTGQEDWSQVMKVCAELPGRSRLVGAFLGEGETPENLAGFAWVLHHGNRAVYHTGASARLPGLKIRVLCPVLWDLIRWSKANQGRWFDLGGVTAGSADPNDPLGRISDFKRGFSKAEASLGEEWALEPSPVLWRAATWMSAAVRRARRG